MNFFIDFDHTLYKTDDLVKDMLDVLAKHICKKCSQDYDEILEKLKSKFRRGKDNFPDIYDLIGYFSSTEQYNFNKEDAIKKINKVISNGNKYLFNDAIPFLQYLKSQGHKIYILSYNENKVYYQTVKIAESGIIKYVDGIMPTIVLKGEMPIDFSQGVFIDDKPRDLISIYNKKPYKIYRIRRKKERYSNLNLEIPIPEFQNLEELKEELEKRKEV